MTFATGEPVQRTRDQITAKSFHSRADALDVAESLLQEEDKRRRKDARRGPALTHLRLEGPAEAALEGTALRRAAFAQRD